MAGGHSRERTSLVVTVLDEASTVEALLESIACQTLLPDEVVIVDGGSNDGTWGILQAWTSRVPLRVLREPGAGIARGRNVAIAAATGELIAVTDAGVRLDTEWLAQLVSALNPGIDVVSGFFRADARTTFERAMGATVLPALQDVHPDTFLPSSRSVLFRRPAWVAVGGYPEWLDYCEDLVFDLALKQAGFRFTFAPGAIVWFRPRESLDAFFRQYYRYARGDGKADLWRRRHFVRFAAYSLAAAVVWRRGPSLALLILGALAYTHRPYARLKPHLLALSTRDRLYALSLVPLIRVVGDVAKMLGYPVGILWRLRHRPPTRDP